MSEVKLVVFDCDGTLVDSQHQIVAAMTAAFAAHGWAAPTPAETRKVIGLTLEDAMAMLTPDKETEAHRSLADTYRQAFQQLREAGDIEDPLFPGVQTVLQALYDAGHVLGIATGKSRRGLDHVLKKYGLADLFVTLQTPDVAPGKPHPAMLEQAMNDTGARRQNTVLVGDTVFDIQMAGHARVASIGVSWGYHTPHALQDAGADHVIDRFEDLVPALNQLWEVRS